MGRADGVVCAALAGGEALQQLAHRRGVLAQPHGVLDQGGGVGAPQRLEVGQEAARAGDVGLGEGVVAGDHRVVRALEEQVLAVAHDLDRAVPAGHDDRGGDVVLGLQLHRRLEVGS